MLGLTSRAGQSFVLRHPNSPPAMLTMLDAQRFRLEAGDGVSMECTVLDGDSIVIRTGPLSPPVTVHVQHSPRCGRNKRELLFDAPIDVRILRSKFAGLRSAEVVA